MINKLKFLTFNSFKRKVKSKWFVIANILLLVVICAVINIDTIINLFGGDFNDPTKIYIVDNTNYSYDLLKENIIATNKSINESTNIEVEKIDSRKEKLKDKEIIIDIKEDINNYFDVTVISNGYIDILNYQVLVSAINNTKVSLAIAKSNIPVEQLNNIYKEVEIKREYLSEKKNNEEEKQDMIMTTVFPILILPFFMLSIFLVQTIGAEVNDEKSTRAMEVIISNVSPKVHFASKIIAANLFVIMQGLLLFLYSSIGILIRNITSSSNALPNQIMDIVKSVSGTGFIEKLIYIIPIILILMLLTFVAYSLLAGILASMTTNAEDLGQLQTPIIIISLLGYYLAIMAGMFKGALFIRIFSYIPFISAILAPSLLVIGEIGLIDIIISIVIMIITNYLLIKYGIKIYKEGILNYTSKDLWKKMFKAMKN